MPTNPDQVTPFIQDWKGLVALLFLVLSPIITAGLPLWFKVKKIDNQVSNDHTENFREEMTRGFREVREDIRLLSTALNTERQERIDGDRLREAA
ncbi:hypothetical protein KIV65_gp68 [Mycobacterium phage Anthony]|uniref:Minor tail protein n=1 Tax=Mycobacterium phage Anthony TaxID=2599857 RepID=A0A5J6THQ4_9CAUD|nr:hypothetical protein KIV65_gp68 [Mycobacterium phage Anthony]QFG10401.1 hypothetical protein PBI_ANTHONY_29 [Mycobacterium phage Anthony]